MRGIHFVFGVLAASLFAACGGGGGGSLGGGSSPAVAGRIVSRDGSTTNLAGVVVQCVESGESDVSDGDGNFAVDAPSGTSFRLKIDDPAGTQGTGDGDCSEGEDGDGDAQDIQGDEVEIDALEDGEDCDIEIEIEDGQIVGVHLKKNEKDGDNGDGEHETGESRLFPPVDGEGYGEVEVGANDGCSWMEIEVGGLGLETTYELVLVGEGGALWPLDGLVTNAEGEGHRALESCNGDRPLPFGVASVTELAGLTLLVKDGDGNVVLEGVVPEVGSEDHHDGHDGKDEGEDEKDDDGKGEDGKGDDEEDGDEKDGDEKHEGDDEHEGKE